MNMNEKIKQIIEAEPVNGWQITDDGTGEYGLSYDGDMLILLRKSKRAFLRYDAYCGGRIEGECYRPHFVEVPYDEAVQAVYDSACGKNITLESEGGTRWNSAPVWLKRAFEQCTTHTAKTHPELTDAIQQEMI